MMNNKKAFALILILMMAVASAAAQRRPAPVDTSDRSRLDVESYTIDVTLMPTEHMLRATSEVKFRQLERSSYVTFDLDNRLKIDKVTLDGAEARFRQYDLDSTVEISTSEGQLSNVSTLRFEYEGFLDPPGAKRAAALSSISENGAYLLYESKWFPTNSLYKDKATAAVTVHVPSGWTAVSDLPGEGSKFSSTVAS
jgi:aminopeptidase N